LFYYIKQGKSDKNHPDATLKKEEKTWFSNKYSELRENISSPG
jgi:hypothetical protein